MSSTIGIYQSLVLNWSLGTFRLYASRWFKAESIDSEHLFLPIFSPLTFVQLFLSLIAIKES